MLCLDSFLQIEQNVPILINFIPRFSTFILRLFQLQVQVFYISLDFLDPLDDFLFEDLLAVLQVLQVFRVASCYLEFAGGHFTLCVLFKHDVLSGEGWLLSACFLCDIQIF
jgi:hypothetical protein